ncbi:MAG TPA: hypothetical protein VKA84_03750, partial [Gemmatimonadaceae bacterium]|nr:hypothetical protein [Gemmatimonadaceae bacterium]
MPRFLADDLRGALRGIRRHPGFSAAVVATLALAIGALSAVFSGVHAVLLRPLPYRDPGRLVMLWRDLRSVGRAEPEWLSFPDFADWRDGSKTLEATAAFTGWQAIIPG